MFEHKIQQAWESYQQDFGLGRICLFICFMNTFLYFLGILAFKTVFNVLLAPIALAFIFYFFRKKITQHEPAVIFTTNAILIVFAIILDYLLVGEFDRAVGQLHRYDEFFHSADIFMFGAMPSIAIETFVDSILGSYSWIFFDFLISCYIVYFLLPVYCGVVYYRLLAKNHKYFIGRYLFSIICFFLFNYIFYLMVPVSGPQYYLSDAYGVDPNFSTYGQFLFNQVRDKHTTYIDCFPSGHFGISVMILLWFSRMKSRHVYIAMIFCFGIGMATITLRYHYVLDLICAVPFTILCYKAGQLLFNVKVEKRQRRMSNV